MVIDDTLSLTKDTLRCISMPPVRPSAKKLPFNPTLPAKVHQPPITRTCRCLREELMPYYYGSKVSVDFMLGGDIGKVGKWLRITGPDNRRMVRGMSLCGSQWQEAAVQRELGVALSLESTEVGACKVLFL